MYETPLLIHERTTLRNDNLCVGSFIDGGVPVPAPPITLVCRPGRGTPTIESDPKVRDDSCGNLRIIKTLFPNVIVNSGCSIHGQDRTSPDVVSLETQSTIDSRGGCNFPVSLTKTSLEFSFPNFRGFPSPRPTPPEPGDRVDLQIRLRWSSELLC